MIFSLDLFCGHFLIIGVLKWRRLRIPSDFYCGSAMAYSRFLRIASSGGLVGPVAQLVRAHA